MPNPMPSLKRETILRRITMPLSMLTWMLLATGCATTKVDQISSDRYVQSLHKGVPFTPPEDGKFVPLARFNEMMDVYIRASFPK